MTAESQTDQLKTFLANAVKEVDEALNRLLPPETDNPTSIHKAMRYSVFAGGKRVRPALSMLGAVACGCNPNHAVLAGCAYECIHTYSLIHDDLPAMDDDDMRRGKPSCHKEFGEDIAILAGDGLLTFAFHVLTDESNYSLKVGARLNQDLSHFAGVGGMVGGQVLDLEAEKRNDLGLDDLIQIHEMKTAALITGAVRAGGIVSSATDDQLNALTRYGHAIGLAFQVTDDILDATQSSDVLGKTAGKDADQGKLTYVNLLGIEKATEEARRWYEEAKNALVVFGPDADLLRDLAAYIINRTS